ncbi:hypothetical protein BCR32DRAFT_295320 [Anaeromyces robustus]|uniref:N-acetyltransferase domain-containing protein n=1 Tax=Anaeromyces robustus TaxID=1754192 RepID=A0A1Y1WX80_9FUNG|nr:hypothetical protein BCR32DRAFT_295320 [Anaeromyces robustus]|eukprot:ORX77938.1 hypothetical protein BCR32DRAFT_295320 [Anaeromyces robustus]
MNTDDITFRKAILEEDFEECLNVICDAFQGYPIYSIYTNKDDKQQQQFDRALMYCQLMDAFVHDTVMVAEYDKQILCVTLIQNPERKEPSVLEYILHLGGLSVFKTGGIKNTFGFLHMVEKINLPREEYSKKTPKTWNLECIAVNKNFKGQGIGSKMINECVVPLVRENGANHLTLITNKEKNTLFYKKNDFKVFQYDKFDINNKLVENWCFTRTI